MVATPRKSNRFPIIAHHRFSLRNVTDLYCYFIVRWKFEFSLLLVIGALVAFLDTRIPVMIGSLIKILNTSERVDLWENTRWRLLAMLLILVVVRPLTLLARSYISNQVITPGITEAMRWHIYQLTLQRDWSFFKKEFAGPVADRVMQMAPALRESFTSFINAVWYVIVLGINAIVLLLSINFRLSIPLIIWACAFSYLLYFFIPQTHHASRLLSKARAELAGRIVDTFTNIVTVKLFPQPASNDRHVIQGMISHTSNFRNQLNVETFFTFSLQLINALMFGSIGVISVWLWTWGSIGVGEVATALPLAWMFSTVATWIAQNVTTIFRNIGVVQEGMRLITTDAEKSDPSIADPLIVKRGQIRFDNVSFSYDGKNAVLSGINLHIRAGERVGIVGRSGAGKSTMIDLLLAFSCPNSGRILIDDVDIKTISQHSLREQIGVVMQDSSLFNRSVEENLRYGRLDASKTELADACRQACAHSFITPLEDRQGRRGYEAHTGERGTNLSGGQKQRIAIARAILKNASILVLDEATSGLDSQTEAMVQEELDVFMRDKTVIVIAHRLSTLAKMDRIIVLDGGQLVEDGTHATLSVGRGIYASLWKAQMIA